MTTPPCKPRSRSHRAYSKSLLDRVSNWIPCQNFAVVWEGGYVSCVCVWVGVGGDIMGLVYENRIEHGQLK